MAVFKPRNRLVNFRVSEEEFTRLQANCASNGARSLSDFAREAVMRQTKSNMPEDTGTIGLSALSQKVSSLETQLQHLLRQTVSS